jgi:hypothetical protein
MSVDVHAAVSMCDTIVTQFDTQPHRGAQPCIRRSMVRGRPGLFTATALQTRVLRVEPSRPLDALSAPNRGIRCWSCRPVPVGAGLVFVLMCPNCAPGIAVSVRVVGRFVCLPTPPSNSTHTPGPRRCAPATRRTPQPAPAGAARSSTRIRVPNKRFSGLRGGHQGIREGASRLRPNHAGLCPLICGVMSARVALCRRLLDGTLRICSDQTVGQAPSHRPGAARSRSGRRATRRRSKPDHVRLALRPERDSPLGGRRGDAYPFAPPRCSCRSSTADHLGDLPARRGRPLRCHIWMRGYGWMIGVLVCRLTGGTCLRVPGS